jgi:hypothetical protein
MIVNYDSSIINKFGASLTDDTRVVIYDWDMFTVQATSLLRTIVNYDRKKFYFIGYKPKVLKVRDKDICVR